MKHKCLANNQKNYSLKAKLNVSGPVSVLRPFLKSWSCFGLATLKSCVCIDIEPLYCISSLSRDI